MSKPNTRTDQPLVEPLTSRELEILAHLAENRSNREIADLLVLSLNTVKWYARQIYGKLGVDNRRQAALRARELELLETSAPLALPAHNLPAQLTPFLGRRQMLAEISQRMSEPAVRLLTVTGPGGIGKTRLAIAAASLLLEEQRDSFQDGVFFVPLAPVSDTGLIAAALAQAIGFQSYPGDEGPEQQLVHYVSNKGMLLVLDNFEHLIDRESIRLLTEILAAAPGTRMLVTSRSRLNVQGEYLFPLGGMEIPDRDTIPQWERPVEQAGAFSGIQLFLHSARRLKPDFELGPDNLAPIADICLSVQGMPLGIELAAGWVAVLDPNEIAAEIAHNLDILATDAGNVPERQQSLRAVFDTSWKLLTEQERQAVQRLAVFQDGFDRKGAQRAGQVSLAILLALVNKSWLQQAAGGRFQIHDLLRRYGQEKLARDPALEAAAHGPHSRYYCDWLAQQEEGTWGAQQQAVLAEIEGDIGNVHAACRWAAIQGRVRRLGRAVNALGLFYFQWHASYQAGERIFRELAEALATLEGWPESATASVQRAMIRVLGWQATLCGLAGDLQREARLLHESQVLLDSPTLADEDTRLERAHIAWQSGYLVLYTDPATARQRFTKGLELYQEIGYKWGMASALLGLGRALRGLNALEKARPALASSLVLQREIGNQHGESEALATLGGLAIRQARFEEAERLIQQSLSITPETDRFGIAFGLGFLGSARFHTGRFVEAEAPLEECLAIHKDLGMRGFRLHWRIFMGRAYLHAGKIRAARTQGELMVSRSQEMDYDRGLRMGLELLGEIALVEGAFTQADQYLGESRRIQDKAAGSQQEPGQWVWLGLAARGLERRAQAWQYLTSGLESARKSHQFLHLMIALAGIALLLADDGEIERAIELYALASRYPLVAKSRWFEDVVGRTITAVAPTLPPQVVHAARERGQARDLDATVAELLEDRQEWGLGS